MKVRTFTKKDIAVEISNRLEATLVDSLTFTDELFLVLRDMLTDEYEKVRIEIRNFGVFEIKPTKAKPNARNPQTNQEIFVPAHKKTHFKPGKILKKYFTTFGKNIIPSIFDDISSSESALFQNLTLSISP